MVKLGCIDIFTEVSLLSAHNVMLHEHQLEAAYHIFAYLKSMSAQEFCLMMQCLRLMNKVLSRWFGRTFMGT
jgi:hypothetical protein